MKILHKKLVKIYFLIMSTMYINYSYAIEQFDFSKDRSNGKDLNTVTSNGYTFISGFATFIIAAFILVGICIAGISFVNLNKAAKSEGRMSVVGPIVGILCGGLMTALSIIVGIVANTFTK